MKTKLFILFAVFCNIANAQKITAIFTGCDTTCAPLFASFTDHSTSNNGPIINWLWSFPGGSPGSSTLQDPVNIYYSTPGVYNVSLVVVNSNGDRDTAVSLACAHVNAWPSAGFTYTVSGTTVTCSNIFSSGTESNAWYFGDGSPQDTNALPVHTYSIGSTYTICHSIKNKGGCWDTACQSVTIASVNDKYFKRFITISPNPFSTQTTLSAGTSSEPAGNLITNATLTVYNLLGDQVKQIKNISGKTITFHRENLPGGLYFIQLTEDNPADGQPGEKIATGKLVITDN